MSDINVVVLVGNLTADPDLRHTQNGTPVANLRIGVSSRQKTGEEWSDRSNFFAITCWGREAEAADRFLRKGARIAVHGRLQFRQYEVDDQKRSAVEIVADQVQYLSPVNHEDDSPGVGESESHAHPFAEAQAGVQGAAPPGSTGGDEPYSPPQGDDIAF